MDSWQTHEWRQPIRLVSIRGKWKEEYFCTRCRRRFVEVLDSGERFAAFPSLLDFEPLAPDVTVEWLSEPCPGTVLPDDVVAYANRPHHSH